MEAYANKSGHSGILRYEAGADYIIVRFVGGITYCYTYNSAGKRAIEAMKKLAKAGKGLASYISQHVKKRYETQMAIEYQ